MAEGFAEEVKRRADIVRVVGEYVQLRRGGQNYFACCPFHDERTGSFAVHPGKQIWHCFGCGLGGDVFSFVQRIESVEFPEAIRRVAEKCGIPLREDDRPGGSERRALLALFRDAADYFVQQLYSLEGRHALDYLKGRGITDLVIKEFGFGYVPGDLSALAKKHGTLVQTARISGLCGRISIPTQDESGRVVALKGRVVGDGKPKYLNTPDSLIAAKAKLLFNLSRAKKPAREAGRIVLVEGELDAVAVWTSGIQEVVGSSTASLTEQQATALSRLGVSVIISYDSDDAGFRGIERAVKALLAAGVDGRVAKLHVGMDPDLIIRNLGFAVYKSLLDDAKEFPEYLIGRAMSAKTKSAGVSYLSQFVGAIPDPVARHEWADKIAARLRIDQQAVRASLSLGKIEIAEAAKRTERAKLLPAAKRLLQILVHSDELRPSIAEALRRSTVWKKQLGEKLFAALLEQPDLTAAADSLMDVPRQALYSLAFEPFAPATAEEAQACLNALWAKRLERELDETQRQIAERGEGADVRELLAYKQHLHKKLASLQISD